MRQTLMRQTLEDRSVLADPADVIRLFEYEQPRSVQEILKAAMSRLQLC